MTPLEWGLAFLIAVLLYQIISPLWASGRSPRRGPRERWPSM